MTYTTPTDIILYVIFGVLVLVTFAVVYYYEKK